MRHSTLAIEAFVKSLHYLDQQQLSSAQTAAEQYVNSLVFPLKDEERSCFYAAILMEAMKKKAIGLQDQPAADAGASSSAPSNDNLNLENLSQQEVDRLINEELRAQLTLPNSHWTPELIRLWLEYAESPEMAKEKAADFKRARELIQNNPFQAQANSFIPNTIKTIYNQQIEAAKAWIGCWATAVQQWAKDDARKIPRLDCPHIHDPDIQQFLETQYPTILDSWNDLASHKKSRLLHFLKKAIPAEFHGKLMKIALTCWENLPEKQFNPQSFFTKHPSWESLAGTPLFCPHKENNAQQEDRRALLNNNMNHGEEGLPKNNCINILTQLLKQGYTDRTQPGSKAYRKKFRRFLNSIKEIHSHTSCYTDANFKPAAPLSQEIYQETLGLFLPHITEFDDTDIRLLRYHLKRGSDEIRAHFFQQLDQTLRNASEADKPLVIEKIKTLLAKRVGQYNPLDEITPKATVDLLLKIKSPVLLRISLEERSILFTRLPNTYKVLVIKHLSDLDDSQQQAAQAAQRDPLPPSILPAYTTRTSLQAYLRNPDTNTLRIFMNAFTVAPVCNLDDITQLIEELIVQYPNGNDIVNERLWPLLTSNFMMSSMTAGAMTKNEITQYLIRLAKKINRASEVWKPKLIKLYNAIARDWRVLSYEQIELLSRHFFPLFSGLCSPNISAQLSHYVDVVKAAAQSNSWNRELEHLLYRKSEATKKTSHWIWTDNETLKVTSLNISDEGVINCDLSVDFKVSRTYLSTNQQIFPLNIHCCFTKNREGNYSVQDISYSLKADSVQGYSSKNPLFEGDGGTLPSLIDIQLNRFFTDITLPNDFISKTIERITEAQAFPSLPRIALACKTVNGMLEHLHSKWDHFKTHPSVPFVLKQYYQLILTHQDLIIPKLREAQESEASANNPIIKNILDNISIINKIDLRSDAELQDLQEEWMNVYRGFSQAQNGASSDTFSSVYAKGKQEGEQPNQLQHQGEPAELQQSERGSPPQRSPAAAPKRGGPGANSNF